MLCEHICLVVEVIGTDEFGDWFVSLNESERGSVATVVDLLEMLGISLPFPYSSAIKGSKIAMRELRIQSGGKPLRVFYVFDPKRQAVLLLGGDKTGEKRFYDTMIPKCESIYADYLKEI